jgi:hypothetical protein
MPETVEGDRVIVSGTSASCFFPRTEQETSFIREFDGRGPAGPFDLGGSVYGRRLQFIGPGECRGVVLGRGDLLLDASRPGERQRFLGSVSANGGIEVKVPPLPVRDTVSGDVRQASVIVRGDVVGDTVQLRNTVVVGNVHGSNVRLTNCVIFGAVVASEQLTVQASTLLYYHCRSVTFEGPCLMLHAMGESARPPVFAPWEDPSGEVFAADVRYYPPIRGQEGGDLGNRPWKRTDGATMSRLFPNADWVTVETVRHGDQAKPASRTALTIAGRALNLVALQLSTSQMVTMLKIGFEFDHYTPRAQREAIAKLKSLATEEEFWVFSSVLEPKES